MPLFVVMKGLRKTYGSLASTAVRADGSLFSFTRRATTAGSRCSRRFADMLAAPERPAIVAVDMPIGLPKCRPRRRTAAENAVRPLLGARQSSVFSVPSRAAIYAGDYSQACQVAQETSEPPRKVSKQLFNIAPKIREVDTVLRADAALARARLRGASRTGVLAAQRRARAHRAEESEEPALSAGARAAPQAAACRPRCRRRWSPPRRRKAPRQMTSSTRSPAPQSRGALHAGPRGRFPIPRRATPTACQSRSGRK